MARKLDRLAELRVQLGPVLAEDESLTVAEPIRRSPGADDAATAERTRRTRTLVEKVAGAPQPHRRRRWFERAADVAASLATGTSPVDLPTPQLPDPNGTALTGPTGSRASRLRDLMGEHSCVLAGTTRRWFVLRDDAGAPTRFRALADGNPLPYGVLAELAREQVRLHSAPTRLARGRLELHFADSSMLALSALTRDRAETLADS